MNPDVEVMLAHILGTVERLEEKLDELIADLNAEPEEDEDGDEDLPWNVWGVEE